MVRWAYNPFTNNLDEVGISGPAGGGTPGDIAVFDASGNLADSGFAFPLTVPGGGTGDIGFTPFALVTGGTTSTSNLQNVSGLGLATQVLTSNGPGLLPTWQAGGGGGGSVSTLTGNSGGAISPTANNINTVGTGSITIAGAGSTLTTQLTGLTNHDVLVGAGTATITSVAPSATSGVPLISQGAAADPLFGTATVPGGGTGAVTLTIHGVLLGEGTGAIVATTAGSTGQVFMGATGADPAFTSTPTFAGASTFTGSVTLNGGLIEKLTTTAVSYQVLVTDVIIGVTDTTAARTITMPNSGLLAGQRWTIKDQSGGAATHAITIAGNGANIDGSANQTMNTNYGSVDIYTDSTNFFLV